MLGKCRREKKREMKYKSVKIFCFDSETNCGFEKSLYFRLQTEPGFFVKVQITVEEIFACFAIFKNVSSSNKNKIKIPKYAR